MTGLKRILHPTDFSATSEAAFAEALTLAQENRAELLLVHVTRPPTPLLEDSFVSPKSLHRVGAPLRHAAERQLARLVAEAKKAGVQARSLVLDGVPYDRIAWAARARRADVIVMGTRGRTGLSKVLLGSVAARVIPIAPCPVLTVRGK